MEARLSRQMLHIIELDRAGHLTPEIQEHISDALDHLHGQIMASGGQVGMPPQLLPVSKAGLGPVIAGGSTVKVPKVSFPKLPQAPKLGKVA